MSNNEVVVSNWIDKALYFLVKQSIVHNAIELPRCDHLFWNCQICGDGVERTVSAAAVNPNPIRTMLKHFTEHHIQSLPEKWVVVLGVDANEMEIVEMVNFCNNNNNNS